MRDSSEEKISGYVVNDKRIRDEKISKPANSEKKEIAKVQKTVSSLVPNSDTKKIIKYAATALGVGVAAIFAYSPGFLALRLSDPSILRATLSIFTGVILAGILGFSTFKFFAPDKKHIKTLNSSIDVTELSTKLKAYVDDEYIGKLASQALTQIDRLNKSIKRVDFELASKFEPTSMTYQNFYAAVDDAGNCAFKNLASFANRIQLYDEDDYNIIHTYKHDAIPDDIQEEQIELMNRNKKLAADALTANENLIVGLEKLVLKIADSNFTEDSKENQEKLDEINKLTETIKYYI